MSSHLPEERSNKLPYRSSGGFGEGDGAFVGDKKGDFFSDEDVAAYRRSGGASGAHNETTHSSASRRRIKGIGYNDSSRPGDDNVPERRQDDQPRGATTEGSRTHRQKSKSATDM